MEGCSAPLVVKFADTQREKEQKKMHHFQTSILTSIKGSNNGTTPIALGNGVIGSDQLVGSLTTASNTAPVMASNVSNNIGISSSVPTNNLVTLPNATALTSNATLMTNPPQTCNPFIGADAISTSQLQFFQQMQAVGLQQQLLQGKYSTNLVVLTKL